MKTPAIDALAADGVVFERAYSHAPQTLPAHASLLSGRLPFETGVRDNVGFVVKAGERLLPQMLRERGFATGGVVSAYVLRKETGINQGFDFFDGEMPPASPDESIERVKRDGSESEAVAERWLDQQRSQRVFLFLHLYEPHRPYTPPQQYAEYDPYDGEIAYADEIVGRLVRHLKTQQLYDRSTIMLLSDHGEGLGDHGEQEHGLFVYDEAIHVPLIIKQAGGAGAGRRIADVVQHVDVAPTILDLAKAPIPGNLRGRSLTPILEGTGTLREQAVYSEAWYARTHFGWSELKTLTARRHRYIEAPTEELYDLERDPGERDNIAAGQPKERQALRTALDALNTSTTHESAVDPKDKREIVERYRKATELAQGRGWTQAIVLLQGIVRDEPQLVQAWNELARVAARVDRFGIAVDAYRHVAELTPSDPSPLLGPRRRCSGSTSSTRRGCRHNLLRTARRTAPRRRRRTRSSRELPSRVAIRTKPDMKRSWPSKPIPTCRWPPTSKDVCSTTAANSRRRCRASKRPLRCGRKCRRRHRRRALLHRGHAAPAGTLLRGRSRVRRAVAHRPAPCAGPRRPGDGVREDGADRRGRTGRHRDDSALADARCVRARRQDLEGAR